MAGVIYIYKPLFRQVAEQTNKQKKTDVYRNKEQSNANNKTDNYAVSGEKVFYA